MSLVSSPRVNARSIIMNIREVVFTSGLECRGVYCRQAEHSVGILPLDWIFFVFIKGGKLLRSQEKFNNTRISHIV